MGSVTIRVEPATADRWDDVVTVLGPSGDSGCWCQAPRGRDTGPRHGDPTYRPELLRAQLGEDPPAGMLAYLDDEPAGWLGFAPRSRLPRLARSRTIPQVDEIDAWAILCFNVRSGYRRRGIATALLDGLVAYARDRGAPALEAYPIDAAGGRVDSGFGYVGLTTWFEAAGFTRVVETDARSAGRPRILMRLPL